MIKFKFNPQAHATGSKEPNSDIDSGLSSRSNWSESFLQYGLRTAIYVQSPEDTFLFRGETRNWRANSKPSSKGCALAGIKVDQGQHVQLAFDLQDIPAS